MIGLTHEKTLECIQTLFDKFFDINALLDRQVYLLDIKWNLPSYQDYVHHDIAHLMPELADKIQFFGSLRGDLFHRGAILAHAEDYNSVSELTERYVLELANLEELCKKCINVASENSDILYEDFLRDFAFNNLAKLEKQAIVFYNAIKVYESNNDLVKWNKDFKSFIINDGGDD